jgi:hypothetical protein
MFDLVSTRPGVDPQSAACARLLETVIADAIDQARTPINQREIKRYRNIDNQDHHPALSIWFLFDDESPFREYAHLIGLSADETRRALLGSRMLDDPVRPLFSYRDREVIKLRYRMYQAEKELKQTGANAMQHTEEYFHGI